MRLAGVLSLRSECLRAPMSFSRCVVCLAFIQSLLVQPTIASKQAKRRRHSIRSESLAVHAVRHEVLSPLLLPHLEARDSEP